MRRKWLIRNSLFGRRHLNEQVIGFSRVGLNGCKCCPSRETAKDLLRNRPRIIVQTRDIHTV
jgi:ribosomal 50S subunit-recycling heat shock protein